EEDQQVDGAVRDPGPDLLVTAERAAQHAVNGEVEFAAEQQARGTGRAQVVPGQQQAVELCPFPQVSLFNVGSDGGNPVSGRGPVAHSQGHAANLPQPWSRTVNAVLSGC